MVLLFMMKCGGACQGLEWAARCGTDGKLNSNFLLTKVFVPSIQRRCAGGQQPDRCMLFPVAAPSPSLCAEAGSALLSLPLPAPPQTPSLVSRRSAASELHRRAGSHQVRNLALKLGSQVSSDESHKRGRKRKPPTPAPTTGGREELNEKRQGAQRGVRLATNASSSLFPKADCLQPQPDPRKSEAGESTSASTPCGSRRPAAAQPLLWVSPDATQTPLPQAQCSIFPEVWPLKGQEAGRKGDHPWEMCRVKLRTTVHCSQDTQPFCTLRLVEG